MFVDINKNRICIVRKDIADVDRGGISFYYKGIIKELVNWGWDVTVITQLPFTNTKARVINVPIEEDFNKNPINVRKALESIDVDIIEASNYKYELVDYLIHNINNPNRPITLVRSEPSGVTCMFGNMYEQGEKLQSVLADYNIAVSKFAARDTEQRYGIKNDQVIYLGIDIERLFSIEEKQYIESGIILSEKGDEKTIDSLEIDSLVDKNKINIFWSGKPTYMKGYDYLQKIVEETSDRYNFILNDTPVLHTIKTINNKGKTLWNLSREDQINLWKRCDVTLLTSRVEGFSLIVGESMLLKKPLVVNTECETIKEFPTQEYIKYFDPNKIEDFINKIEAASKLKFELNEKQISFFDSRRLAIETHFFYKKVLSFKKLSSVNTNWYKK